MKKRKSLKTVREINLVAEKVSRGSQNAMPNENDGEAQNASPSLQIEYSISREIVDKLVESFRQNLAPSKRASTEMSRVLLRLR